MTIKETRDEAAASFQRLAANDRRPPCNVSQYADNWVAYDADYAIGSIDLRHWRNDPDVQEAVREARDAVRHASNLIRKSVWRKP
jgi:hypothetical protein